ncbi:hypothetical protein [Falsiroseomonas sp. E2-1-a20]|uniref:hypothetical protein n=1 Tax=Falsiroseomonas sp. E2-1-a20 TaxID=3239300 RepID=UPI003F3FE5ED
MRVLSVIVCPNFEMIEACDVEFCCDLHGSLTTGMRNSTVRVDIFCCTAARQHLDEHKVASLRPRRRILDVLPEGADDVVTLRPTCRQPGEQRHGAGLFMRLTGRTVEAGRAALAVGNYLGLEAMAATRGDKRVTQARCAAAAALPPQLPPAGPRIDHGVSSAPGNASIALSGFGGTTKLMSRVG